MVFLISSWQMVGLNCFLSSVPNSNIMTMKELNNTSNTTSQKELNYMELGSSYQTWVKDLCGSVRLITHYSHSLVLRLFDNVISTAGLI
jgi:hypothetical protein